MTEKQKQPDATLVDTRGTHSPAAARFGVGASTPAEINEAADWPRAVNPADVSYYRRDREHVDDKR